MFTVHLALPRTQFALLLFVPVSVPVSVSVSVCVCVCVVSSFFLHSDDRKILVVSGSAYEFLCGVVISKFSLVVNLKFTEKSRFKLICFESRITIFVVGQTVVSQ